MLDKLERKLGLPKLAEMTSLLSGDSGKRLEGIIGKLEKLSESDKNLQEIATLLNTIERLDQSGALVRLDDILKELVVLSKSKSMKSAVDAAIQLGPMLKDLVKSEN